MAIYEQRNAGAYENIVRFNFFGCGKYDIPFIEKDDVNPTEFIGFNYAKTHKSSSNACVHFFLTITNFKGYGTDPMIT